VNVRDPTYRLPDAGVICNNSLHLVHLLDDDDEDDFIGMAANRLDYKVHCKLQKKKK